MNAILERMKEPSSWAGFSLLLGLLGVPVGVPELVAQVGAGVCALAAVLLKEKGAGGA